MKKIVLLIATLCCMLPLMAQSEGEQVLVFRNTGEVNLFYSDRLDSVVCSPVDADGVLHEEAISQIFYARDTTMLIPLAEIDSVAFGERNVMEFKEDVRELAEADLQWIIRTVGNAIYYRQDTPPDVLPVVGQKLFSGFDASDKQLELFPDGLSAKVVSVQAVSGEICVSLEFVELNEIFNRLFFAGHVSEISPINVRRKMPVQEKLEVDVDVPLGEQGELSVNGNILFDGDIVTSIIGKERYFHADLDAEYGFGFNVSLKSDDSDDIVDYEELLWNKCIGTYYKILNLNAGFGAFAEISAEMTLGFEMERTYRRKILWTRKGDDNSFEIRNGNGDEPYEDSATLDLTLDGSVYFGPLLQLDFALAGDVLGARAKLKLGPEFEGKISLGLIRQMRDYNPQLYGSAELTARSKLSFEGFLINRHYIIWGEVDEHPIFNCDLTFGEHSLNLFPNYTETRGTQMATKEAEEVSVATKSDGEIAHELETGFEILDEETQEVIDSTFVGIIEAETKEVVGISTEFELPAQTEKPLVVRPIFHYAGYTVSAAPAQIQKGLQIQPVIFSGSNGVVSYASSYPFTGEVTGDGTNYRAGAYLPIAVRDTVFQKGPKVIEYIDVIDSNQEEELMGTWSGTEGETDVTYTFNEDKTGSLNGDAFIYELNKPQSGQIMIMFEDKNKSPLILTILRLREGIIQYHRAKDNNIYTLTKKN